MYWRPGIKSHGCTARGACGDFEEPRVDAPAVKDVTAGGEFPATLAAAKGV